MNKLTAMLIVGLAFCALSALGQATDPQSSATAHQKAVTGAPGAPAAVDPASTSPAGAASPHQKAAVGQTDATGGATFVTQASQAGMAEVELSKLAVNKASDDKVKSLASTMVQDHTRANEELKSLAAKKGMSVASALDPEHAAKVREIGQKSGHAFDQAYVQQMAADHQQAVALFQQESNDSHSELASFAGNTLPVLEHHQQMVNELQKNMH